MTSSFGWGPNTEAKSSTRCWHALSHRVRQANQPPPGTKERKKKKTPISIFLNILAFPTVRTQHLAVRCCHTCRLGDVPPFPHPLVVLTGTAVASCPPPRLHSLQADGFVCLCQHVCERAEPKGEGGGWGEEGRMEGERGGLLLASPCSHCVIMGNGHYVI